jgi:hypothetical protein
MGSGSIYILTRIGKPARNGLLLAAKLGYFSLWCRDALNRLRSRHDAYALKLFENE